MKSSLRNIAIAVACFVAGIGFVAAAALAWSALGPSDDAPTPTATPEIQPDPEQVTVDEVEWLTSDCLSSDAWPEGEIPESAVVRDVESFDLDRVPFDAAWSLAEAGEAWGVALCSEVAP